MADIKDVVKEKYGKAALRVTEGAGTSCCGPTNDALRRADSTSRCSSSS